MKQDGNEVELKRKAGDSCIDSVLNADKELVWKKLSSVPNPLLTDKIINLDSMTLRFKLQKYLGFTAAEIDGMLDGYQSRTK